MAPDSCRVSVKGDCVQGKGVVDVLADSVRYTIALQYSFSLSMVLIFRKFAMSATICPMTSGIYFFAIPIVANILFAAMFSLLKGRWDSAAIHESNSFVSVLNMVMSVSDEASNAS